MPTCARRRRIRPEGPLFRTAVRTGNRLTLNRMLTADVWRMIRRRVKKADIQTPISLPQLPGDRHHQLP